MGKLETYLDLKSKMDEAAKNGKLKPNEVLALQEVNYRIDVLQTFKAFCNTAPVTDNKEALCFHFTLTQKYIENVISERKIGIKGDDKLKEKRQTAEASLRKVVNDGVRKFRSYAPSTKEKYRRDVCDYIVNVLSVWFPYRDQYVAINL